MATIKTPDNRPQMATVRPRSNHPLPRDSSREGKIIEVGFDTHLHDRRVEVLGYRKDETDFVNLEEAEIVVAGGRGLKKGDNVSLLKELGSLIGAEVGASRDAVDRGWMGYPHQIGLSGKTISPKLYIGAGISGSIQHLAGIKTSETIVSINSDPGAPLHKVADFALVGDLFAVIPEMIKQLGGDGASANAFGPPAETGTAPAPRPQGKQARALGYGTVTPAIVGKLEALLGKHNVIVDAERLESYSHDETEAAVYAHSPEVAVLPGTTEEVAAVVTLAAEARIPITPRGAGSGLSGGAIPSYGGILISLERMNRIVELDPDNMTVTVEAGVVTNDLAQMVQERGLFFAGYPMSLESCYIGGNIAENAGGGKAVKYGVTGRYVQGLELVTPGGDVVFLGGKATKDVSGYDLKQLVVGSEGTLGIVTTAIIKLIGYPTASADLLVLFRTPREAIDAVPAILTKGIVPTSIEFMDRISAETSCRYLNESLPYEKAGAMLLIEIDGSRPEQVEADLLIVGELCREQGSLEVYVAEDKNTRERIWNVRRNIAEAFKVFSPVQSLEDIVVPTSRIPELIPELERMSRKFGIAIPCYGHAGDGNLHATLVKDPEMEYGVWQRRENECLRELYALTTRLGGKISGEHGIGIKRKKFLAEVIDPVELTLMKAIKAAWDPRNIMNPGKIFDMEE